MTPAVSLAAILVRWLTICSMAALIGGLVLDLHVLPRSAPELLPARRHLRRWTRVWVAALTCATLAELLLRAQTMSGGGAPAAMAVIPTVLARTHFGTLWLARLALLAVALVASCAAAPSARVIALVAAVGIALTSSLTGHAADWGDRSLSVLVDWIHVVAASAWTGGLVGLGFVVAVARRAWAGLVVSAVARRFSRMAGACVLVVASSGLYGAWVEVPALSALWTTVYGRWLLVKLALVLGIVTLGAVNRYAIVPRLPGAGARARLFRLVVGEAALAVAVFGATAALTESPPARHAPHLMHSAESGNEDQHMGDMPPAARP